ncbi:hypothetical protein RFI_20986 [Reticulomyxa filosa]|uniref:Uncharacterized protein n=1 Tax=Reticulomyxa filosa TaxID=46433 RepID=X6MSF6_RETFI|nr:hypothetical protein RFI_20986 [Reticulomyxa filosa]|eukprot:ETO16362.1 hypothetical protein RFI_20986 [Reticulomyxa filosa]
MTGRVIIDNGNIVASPNGKSKDKGSGGPTLTGFDRDTFALLDSPILTYLDYGLHRVYPQQPAPNSVSTLLLDASKSENWNDSPQLSLSSSLKFDWQCKRFEWNQYLSQGWNTSARDCEKKITNYLIDDGQSSIALPIKSLENDTLYYFTVDTWDALTNQTSYNGRIGQYVVKSTAIDIPITMTYQPIVAVSHQSVTISITLLLLSRLSNVVWNVTASISPSLLNGTSQLTATLKRTSVFDWVIAPVSFIPGQTYIFEFKAVYFFVFFFLKKKKKEKKKIDLLGEINK